MSLRRVSSCKGCDFDSLLPDCSPGEHPPARPTPRNTESFFNGNSRGYRSGAWDLCQRFTEGVALSAQGCSSLARRQGCLRKGGHAGRC